MLSPTGPAAWRGGAAVAAILALVSGGESEREKGQGEGEGEGQGEGQGEGSEERERERAERSCEKKNDRESEKV